ncbi:hypothetical protein SGLAM104S_06548 [Streptomyces glaucescens]
MPDPSTVRPEEFVNSFRQDYERPDGNGFSVTVDGARTGDGDWSLVRVGLATRPAATTGNARPPPSPSSSTSPAPWTSRAGSTSPRSPSA